MIRSLFRGALALAALSLGLAPAFAGTLAVKDATGTTQNMCVVTQADGSLAYCITPLLPQLTMTPGLIISGSTSAQPLFNANPSRHVLKIQIQGAQDTTGANGCYISGTGTATADANSLFIPRGGYYVSDADVGTGATSIICTGTLGVWSRQG